MTTPLVRLGDYCFQDRTSIRPGEEPGLRYVGLESIESNTGNFADGELSKTPDTPKANSFRFGNEHVLYGKLRPYLNKVALPDFEGKCSTEIIPLRPSHDLDRRYLAYFLRSPTTVSLISERTAGSRMPRADMNAVMKLLLPLPSLDEQHRIVDLVSRAEGIIRLRRDAQTKAKEIIPALFVDLFGDPGTNPKAWPQRALPDVLGRPFKNGLYVPRERYCAQGSTEGVEMVHMSDAFYGEVRRGNLRRIRAAPKEISDYQLTHNDLLIARRSLNFQGAAKVCHIPSSEAPLLFESSFIRITPDQSQVLPWYLLEYLNHEATRAAHITRKISGIVISGINQKALSDLPILVPPLTLQKRFVAYFKDVSSLIRQYVLSISIAERTLASLCNKAFHNKTIGL